MEEYGVYKHLPFPVVFRRELASKADRAIARNAVTRFISEARAGNEYKTGASFGSDGIHFRVVKRGNGRLYIDRGNPWKPILLNRQNVFEYIKNGAWLVNAAN